LSTGATLLKKYWRYRLSPNPGRQNSENYDEELYKQYKSALAIKNKIIATVHDHQDIALDVEWYAHHS
jgi:hypothetical protein